MTVIKVAICDDIKRELDSGEILRMRRKLSQMFEEMINGEKIPVPRRSSEEVQKTYMDFCRKEALK